MSTYKGKTQKPLNLGSPCVTSLFYSQPYYFDSSNLSKQKTVPTGLLSIPQSPKDQEAVAQQGDQVLPAEEHGHGLKPSLGNSLGIVIMNIFVLPSPAGHCPMQPHALSTRAWASNCPSHFAYLSRSKDSRFELMKKEIFKIKKKTCFKPHPNMDILQPMQLLLIKVICRKLRSHLGARFLWISSARQWIDLLFEVQWLL